MHKTRKGIDKMNARTDLALESAENHISNGIEKRERGEVFSITEIIIADDKSGEPIGKRKGRYVTLEGRSFGMFSTDFREMCKEFADELSGFLTSGTVLVAGLGNSSITPDALGPMTASKVLATRHLRQEYSDEAEFLSDLRPVSVISGGVLGQTGIETAELIKAAAQKVEPECIIAVDALACRSIERLGRTIQLSDSGISPGSGVQNSRKELSKSTLGVPVIAVGVPTVVDMHTIADELTGSRTPEKLPNMMVAPRDVDRLMQRASSVISAGINMALQPQLSFEEIEDIMW